MTEKLVTHPHTFYSLPSKLSLLSGSADSLAFPLSSLSLSLNWEKTQLCCFPLVQREHHSKPSDGFLFFCSSTCRTVLNVTKIHSFLSYWKSRGSFDSWVVSHLFGYNLWSGLRVFGVIWDSWLNFEILWSCCKELMCMVSGCDWIWCFFFCVCFEWRKNQMSG